MNKNSAFVDEFNQPTLNPEWLSLRDSLKENILFAKLYLNFKGRFNNN